MNTFNTVTEFFGWCSVINIGLLAITALFMLSLRKRIAPIHAKMFGLDEDEIIKAYFQYLAQYKIAVIVLNIVPYLALKLMT